MTKDNANLKKFADIMNMSGTGNEDITNQFIDILLLPDEKFKAISGKFLNSITEVIDSSSYQKEVLSSLAMTPIESVAGEKEAVQQFISEINADPELSSEKKNFLTTLLSKITDNVLEMADNPREKVSVKIQRLADDVELPTYAHQSDAGADVKTVTEVVLKAGETKIVPTGFKVAVPKGYMMNICPRSGISSKTPLRICNTPAIIDSDYRGEVGIIIQNTGSKPYTIGKGTKIAQLLIMPTPMIKWEEVEELDTTSRGEGGFGSTDGAANE